MKLPIELTKVTPLSKYLAMVIFITLPFVGFFLGMRYQEMLNLANRQQMEANLAIKRVPTPTPIAIPTADPSITANWKTFIYADHSFSLKYPPIWYTVYSSTFSSINPPSFSGHFSFFDVGTDAQYSAGDLGGNEVLQIFLSIGNETVSDFKRMDKSLGTGRIEETTVDNKPAVKYEDTNSIRYDIKPSPNKTMTIRGVGKEVLSNIAGIISSLKFNE